MRIWSLHPQYLDTKGLLALWRETLLAQKVLSGETRGYKNHPQIVRFRESGDPLGAIGYYLEQVALEADKRGYSFDKSKINVKRTDRKIRVTNKQLAYEFAHLSNKLKTRNPGLLKKISAEAASPEANPVFQVIEGEVETWEKLK